MSKRRASASALIEMRPFCGAALFQNMKPCCRFAPVQGGQQEDCLSEQGAPQPPISSVSKLQWEFGDLIGRTPTQIFVCYPLCAPHRDAMAPAGLSRRSSPAENPLAIARLDTMEIGPRDRSSDPVRKAAPRDPLRRPNNDLPLAWPAFSPLGPPLRRIDPVCVTSAPTDKR